MEELFAWFADHADGHPIVEAAVGAGKSVMLAWLCWSSITSWAGTRIIMLVPQKELLEQNLGKILEVWPEAPIGIHSASVGRKDLGHDILVATIGSIYKRAHEVGRVDLLLVDECHLIPGGDLGMYRTFIADLTKYNPNLRVIGWTGTPFRGNGEWLTVVENPLFTHIVSRVTMDELLAAGYLAPLTNAPCRTRFDASGVGTSGGDYIVSQLAAAIDLPPLVEAACDELVALAADRKKWLVYCVTVEHATHVCAALQARGVAAAVVSAETHKTERASILARFRAGEIRAICNVAVLTTGFDVPEVDCIALMRNTKSPVLYVQIAGRGMRIHPNKTDCLFLDFTDTVELLGPVNKVKGRNRKRRSEQEAPVKVCDECGSLNPISAKQCSTCGTEFVVEERDPHRTTASTATILQIGAQQIESYSVTNVTYAHHRKPGKPDSLRVEYWSGIKVVAREWVCLEHDGFARSRAESWWRKRTNLAAPFEVAQALQYINEFGLPAPESIEVNVSSKYPEIVKVNFNVKEAA